MSVTIIAEAGVNHDGSPDKAVALVEAAGAAGANVVKFQTFRASSLVTAEAPKAEYQKRATGGASQFEMLSKLELTEAGHSQVLQACRDRGIEFMSSPFDVDSLRYLVERCEVQRIKLGSGELTNAVLLLAAARTGLPLILSTGMATLAEVEAALGVVAFGRFSEPSASPSRAAFHEAFVAADGGQSLGETVTLLHCVSQYPAPSADVNLRAMDTMRHAFGIPVGYSDHTDGPTISIAAAARGATVLEKHLTLNCSDDGPDHAASMEPDDFRDLVASVRAVESALGNGRKVPARSERETALIARRGVVARRPIAQGERLTLEALAVKRPERGPSPLDLWDLVGRPAAQDIDTDQPIRV